MYLFSDLSPLSSRPLKRQLGWRVSCLVGGIPGYRRAVGAAPGRAVRRGSARPSPDGGGQAQPGRARDDACTRGAHAPRARRQAAVVVRAGITPVHGLVAVAKVERWSRRGVGEVSRSTRLGTVPSQRRRMASKPALYWPAPAGKRGCGGRFWFRSTGEGFPSGAGMGRRCNPGVPSCSRWPSFWTASGEPLASCFVGYL